MTNWNDLWPQMVDYDDATYSGIKKAAARWASAMRGQPETADRRYGTPDFLAQSLGRDPFYMGAPSTIAGAKWFMQVWVQQGMDKRAEEGREVYVRTMHYVATAEDELERIVPPPPPWGGGRAYENTPSDYDQMVSASAAARYLGYLPFDAVIDNRNKASAQHADDHPFGEEIPEVYVSDSETKVDEILLPHPDDVTNTPTLRVLGYIANQRYLLQVWTEKDKIRSMILPMLKRYNADFVVANGETSITQTYAFCLAAIKANRSARLFYMSDYDHAGFTMPLAVARRIEWFVYSPESPLRDEFQDYLDNGNDIQLVALATTKEQKAQYRLPETKLKPHVLKTAKAWVAEYGTKGVELDLLDIPRLDGVLASFVKEALAPFFDADLAARVNHARSQAQWHVMAREEALLEQYREKLDALRDEYEVIYDDVMPKLNDIRESIRKTLAEIEETLEDAREDIEADVRREYPVPAADTVTASDSHTLFSTARSYFENLVAYKRHMGKLQPGTARDDDD